MLRNSPGVQWHKSHGGGGSGVSGWVCLLLPPSHTMSPSSPIPRNKIMHGMGKRQGRGSAAKGKVGSSKGLQALHSEQKVAYRRHKDRRQQLGEQQAALPGVASPVLRPSLASSPGQPSSSFLLSRPILLPPPILHWRRTGRQAGKCRHEAGRGRHLLLLLPQKVAQGMGQAWWSPLLLLLPPICRVCRKKVGSIAKCQKPEACRWSRRRAAE